MGTDIRHPLFARLQTRLAVRGEQLGAAGHRQELLAGLSGRVIELGSGSGPNFRHCPDQVTELVAVEPEPYMRSRAEQAAGDCSIPITVIDALADQLPFEDGSFDAGVAAQVLCSVPDQVAALTELRRVLRPGAELRFYEHVVAERPGLARAQRSADRIFWPRIAGGCHTSRDTLAAIERAGFDVARSRRFAFKPSPCCALVAPHILGVAHWPSPLV